MLRGVIYLNDPVKPATPAFFPGRLSKRHPHKAVSEGRLQNSNYELKFPAFTTTDPFNMNDPHQS